MRTTLGVAIVAVAGVALLTLLARWRRSSGPVPLVLLAVVGAAIGTGALLLQDDPGPADWAVTLAVLAAGTPMHFRFLLGPPGPAR
ncbi:MAG TPA: hypothetical protein VFT27_01120 [Actinomycetota bacterium]|nr:hypothetical protein [Actinomycetota bacterium]